MCSRSFGCQDLPVTTRAPLGLTFCVKPLCAGVWVSRLYSSTATVRGLRFSDRPAGSGMGTLFPFPITNSYRHRIRENGPPPPHRGRRCPERPGEMVPLLRYPLPNRPKESWLRPDREHPFKDVRLRHRDFLPGAFWLPWPTQGCLEGGRFRL